MRHPCLAQRCPELVGRGERYCPKHEHEAQQRDVQQRGTASQRGYDAAWDGGPRLDPRNLQALCRSCHGVKTHAEVKARESHRGGFAMVVSSKGGVPKTSPGSSSSLRESSGEIAERFFA
jgi:5-methylcytosine-specific restriction endonuclease McrA